MSEPLETTPIYFHNCPAFGPQTRVPRALMASKGGEYVLCYQHKCPMCGYTAGNAELAPGVTQNADGSWSVNTAIAEKMH